MGKQIRQDHLPFPMPKRSHSLVQEWRNLSFLHWEVEPEKLPFEDQKFDVILIVDVIHHLDDIKKNINEIKRVLKKGGKLLIYEPNKLNPLIWLTHLIDKNERGLLRVGSFKKYRENYKKITL